MPRATRGFLCTDIFFMHREQWSCGWAQLVNFSDFLFVEAAVSRSGDAEGADYTQLFIVGYRLLAISF